MSDKQMRVVPGLLVVGMIFSASTVLVGVMGWGHVGGHSSQCDEVTYDTLTLNKLPPGTGLTQASIDSLRKWAAGVKDQCSREAYLGWADYYQAQLKGVQLAAKVGATIPVPPGGQP